MHTQKVAYNVLQIHFYLKNLENNRNYSLSVMLTCDINDIQKHNDLRYELLIKFVK